MASRDTDTISEEARNRAEAPICAELRFPQSVVSVRGELFRSPSERTLLSLRLPEGQYVPSLPGASAILHIATSACHYTADVQVLARSPVQLELRLLNLVQRTRRKAGARHELAKPVMYRPLSTIGKPEIWRSSISSDLSNEGVGLIIPRALAPGQTLEVGISLDPTQRQVALLVGLTLRTNFLALPAHILYCVAQPDSCWRVGTRFTALTALERTALLQLFGTQNPQTDAETPDD